MPTSSLVVLKNRYAMLSKAERAVADYVLAKPEAVTLMAVSEVAAQSGVAPSTVVRLCKNLGFTGFLQFKSLLLAPRAQAPTLLPALSREDDDLTIFKKVFSSSIRTLHDTLDMLDPAVIKRVAQCLANARTITFFGVGTSATVAMDAYYRFMRIGRPSFYAVDNHIMRVAAAQLRAGDVAVALSHSGETIDTIQTVRIAREAGAFTIALTSHAQSPICTYAHETLVVYSDEIHYPMEAVSARIAHIAALDALCVCMSVRDYDKSLLHISQVQALYRPLRREKADD